MKAIPRGIPDGIGNVNDVLKEISSPTTINNKLTLNGNVNIESGLEVQGGLGTEYVVRIAVNTDEQRAIGVANVNDLESDVFRVTGDGTVWATALRTRLKSDFPDYVFEKGYDLMKFSELETYINKNHRLPNIPSASEVEKEGMDVGEMQILMMEKIEELTLYILELNGKNEQLEKEVNLLKTNK